MVAGAEGQVSAATKREAQQRKSPLPCKAPTRYMISIIENIATKVFLDSGSDISLISEALRMSVPSLRTKPMQRSELLPRAVTGDYLDNLGTLPITIRLGNEMFTHIVQVVRNITQPVILGWDFLLSHRAVMNVGEGNLKVGNTTVPLLRATEVAPLSCHAVTLSPIVVPAMSQMTVLAKVQPTIGVTDLDTDYTGVLEPGPPSFQGLLAALRTLAHVQAGLTYVTVMNPTNTELQVPSNTRLGDFHALDEDHEVDFHVEDPSVSTVTARTEPSFQQLLPDVDLSQAEITDEQRHKLQSLLLSYSDVFSAHDHNYGHTNIVRHSIRTGDAPPIKQRAYRTSPNMRAEIDRQVQQLLSQNIIEESCSPWSSPVVLIRKKDGSYRFCID